MDSFTKWALSESWLRSWLHFEYPTHTDCQLLLHIFYLLYVITEQISENCYSNKENEETTEDGGRRVDGSATIASAIEAYGRSSRCLLATTTGLRSLHMRGDGVLWVLASGYERH